MNDNPLKGSSKHAPEWIRLPKAGAFFPHCGLSRSAMYRLVRDCPENDFHVVSSFCHDQAAWSTTRDYIDQL